MSDICFVYDPRLGIPIPRLERDWESYSAEEQAEAVMRWEQIRSAIPDRILELEQLIRGKLELLGREEHFPTCCRINEEIAELAGVINELNLWYRVQPELIEDVRFHD